MGMELKPPRRRENGAPRTCATYEIVGKELLVVDGLAQFARHRHRLERGVDDLRPGDGAGRIAPGHHSPWVSHPPPLATRPLRVRASALATGLEDGHRLAQGHQLPLVLPVGVGDGWLRLMTFDLDAPTPMIKVRTYSTHYKAFSGDLPNYAAWYRPDEHPKMTDAEFLAADDFTIVLEDFRARFGEAKSK